MERLAWSNRKVVVLVVGVDLCGISLVDGLVRLALWHDACRRGG